MFIFLPISALLCKRWTMRFRLPHIKTNPNLLPFGNSFGLSAFGGDGGNRSFASFAASQPFAFYVPFADAKDGLCGFDYRLYENNPNLLPFGNSFGLSAFGGDGGNRNRKGVCHRIFTKNRKRPRHKGLRHFYLSRRFTEYKHQTTKINTK